MKDPGVGEESLVVKTFVVCHLASYVLFEILVFIANFTVESWLLIEFYFLHFRRKIYKF